MSEPDFTLDVTEQNGIKIITCAGYLDLNTYEELKNAIEDFIKAGVYKMVINLSRVKFIGSAGWSAILSYLWRARKGGGDIHLASISRSVKSSYKLTNFKEIIGAYETVDKAIAAFT